MQMILCKQTNDNWKWIIASKKITNVDIKDTSKSSGNAKSWESKWTSQQDKATEQDCKLVMGKLRSHVVDKHMDLTQSKYTECLNQNK